MPAISSLPRPAPTNNAAAEHVLGIEVVHFGMNGSVGRTRLVALRDYLRPLHPARTPVIPVQDNPGNQGVL